MGKKPRRPRMAFTPEFKAKIVEVRRRRNRTVDQVAKDFDLTETAAEVLADGSRTGWGSASR
ncbi:hypothetical protein [Micromonospora sp. NPDC092111]|uniref:hypothetical protein n=1 Tax=Micromonospora sp. NPDC092111 TaxID=3364289 RepID=UPI00381861A0